MKVIEQQAVCLWIWSSQSHSLATYYIAVTLLYPFSYMAYTDVTLLYPLMQLWDVKFEGALFDQRKS